MDSTTLACGHPLSAAPYFPHHLAKKKRAFSLRSFFRQIYIEGDFLFAIEKKMNKYNRKYKYTI